MISTRRLKKQGQLEQYQSPAAKNAPTKVQLLSRSQNAQKMSTPQSKYLVIQTAMTCSGLLMAPFAVNAAVAPDAGAIQHQVEQTLKQPTTSVPTPVQAVPKAPITASETQVTVSGFDFTGNSLVTNATLEENTRSFLNRPLSLNELRMVTDAVQKLYQDAGWMVRVLLPAQEMQNGRIRIEIIEARLGMVLHAGESSRIRTSVIEGVVKQQLPPNAPIPEAGLERALMILSDLPGVSSSAGFAQGAQPGQTDLVINLQDKPMVSGLASLDNMGSTSTGTTRLLGTVNVNSPSQIGDLLSMTGLKTEGSHYGRIAYSLPVAADGWRLGLHSTDVGYRVIGPASTIHGTARTNGMSSSYPLIRRQLQTLVINGSWEDKSFRNEDGGDGSHYSIRVGTLALTANTQDNWVGGGINNASLQWTNGRVSPITHVLDESTRGQFSKWLISVGRVQTLTPGLNLFATGQIQRTNKNLDSSEKLYLGGAYGVRAYPGTEGAASEGESLSLELSQRLQEGVSINGFYDWAHARDPQVSEATLRSYRLRGLGLSATWQATSQLQLKATAARRIGDAPQPINTFSASRLWLSANFSF